MLQASGETVEGHRPSDWFDVSVDDQGNFVVLLMDIRSVAESSDGFLASVMGDTRARLRRCDPLHTIVCGLELQLAAYPGVEAGLVILRISQRDAKVELLNAGMPAAVNAGPGGRLDLYPALSGPVGRRVGEVHAYELLPLVWGGTWLALSDGMTRGSTDAEAVTALCEELDLAAQGLSLSVAGSDGLREACQDLLPARPFVKDDASIVVVAADPSARFQSTIV